MAHEISVAKDQINNATEDKIPISILWFRHGLRLHDNPAFVAATSNKEHHFLPLFIFDGESAGMYKVKICFI